MKTVFLRLLEADDKAAALRSAIDPSSTGTKKTRFEVDAAVFATVPRSPFAYWVREELLQIFKKLPLFESNGRIARQGLATANDFRFVRAWWEIRPESFFTQWFSFAKGGKFSPFYADVYLVLNWLRNGAELKAWAGSLYNESHWSRILKNTDLFLRPGLTWPRRTNGLSLRAMPAGCIFADKGPAAFVEGDRSDDLLAIAAISNSTAFGLLVSLQLARTELAQSYEVGLIQCTPVPILDTDAYSTLVKLARLISIHSRSLDMTFEASHAFSLPALLVGGGDSLAMRAKAFSKWQKRIKSEILFSKDELDIQCFDLYGIEESDRAVTQGFALNSIQENGEESVDSEDEENGSGYLETADKEDESEVDGNTSLLAIDLISWAVGIAFGRFDIRLATGQRALPSDPEPFDPLPSSSPGMLTGDDGLPLTHPSTDYPIQFPENGILFDDLGHAHDLTAAIKKVFDEVFKSDVDKWWDDVGTILDPKSHDLRNWLAVSFFDHHLVRYSKSKRKAPIIWQFGIPSGSYSVWLYAHRLTRDTLFQIQSDVTLKITHEENVLTRLLEGISSSVKERKNIAAQEILTEELRSFLNEIKRVAPLWNPTLEDGIVLTMAPLWRLVPQHKVWQKELKSKWNDLVSGKYDWAHVAMHLWPERVVPKCKSDRSLAIAHGLEGVFWFEDAEDKWQPRQTPTKPVEELVQERSSPAVKAALNSLLDAPVANSNSGRGRSHTEASA